SWHPEAVQRCRVSCCTFASMAAEAAAAAKFIASYRRLAGLRHGPTSGRLPRRQMPLHR
ncbi:hypothetical protein CH063_14669, partial [Colletotrichum higginsianum]